MKREVVNLRNIVITFLLCVFLITAYFVIGEVFGGKIWLYLLILVISATVYWFFMGLLLKWKFPGIKPLYIKWNLRDIFLNFYKTPKQLEKETGRPAIVQASMAGFLELFLIMVTGVSIMVMSVWLFIIKEFQIENFLIMFFIGIVFLAAGHWLYKKASEIIRDFEFPKSKEGHISKTAQSSIYYFA